MTVSTGSQHALERYSAGLRKERIWYTVIVALVAVAASIITAVVWLSGEISHTTLHTVAKAPADVALRTTSTAPRLLWSTTDRPAQGTPYEGGSVVTFDAHTVRGRDGRTGTQTWSYTRTDRTVCTALQVNGVTVAVYRLNGNCDELTGLDSGTGRRQWTRTLDLDTHQFNGAATFGIAGYAVMFVSSTVIYSVNTTSGNDNWLFAEKNCTITSAVLGTAGALISQTCVHRDCTQLTHCLNGPQLVFRDPTMGENTDSSKNHRNPDQVTWAIPNKANLVPASAGTLVSAYAADGSSLAVLANKDGKTSTTLPLHSSAHGLAARTEAAVSDGEVFFTGGATYAVTGTPGSILWSIASAAAPTVTSGAIAVGTDLSQSTLTMSGPAGVVLRNPANGAVQRSYPTSPAPQSTARVYPYGSGFLVAGSAVTVYS